jgi:hypothetical protein
MESEGKITAIGSPIMFYICTEEHYNASLLHNVLHILAILLLLPLPLLVALLGSWRGAILVLNNII